MNRSELPDELRNELRNELRKMPRRSASPGFTGRVLRELDRQNGRRPTLSTPRGWLSAAATVATLLALSLGVAQGVRAHQRGERLAALRAEGHDLQAELDALRQFADQPPRIYLGGDDDTDLVLDLAHLAQEVGDRGFRTAGRDGDGRPHHPPHQATQVVRP